jgi:hypothetical protein
MRTKLVSLRFRRVDLEPSLSKMAGAMHNARKYTAKISESELAEKQFGRVYSVSGPVVVAEDMAGAAMCW